MYGQRDLNRLRTRNRFRTQLEQLESRLAPALFAVSADLTVSRLGDPSTAGAPLKDVPAVVFLESSVGDYEVLREGLDASTDAVVLDSRGDGLQEMAAFLAGRRGLTTIGVVAHGSPGAVSLGTAILDADSLKSYARELGTLRSAFGPGGELDLWSCEVAAGEAGHALVQDLAAVTGARLAASEHGVGSAALGGSWRLDVRVGAAQGATPFSAVSRNAFSELLGQWSLAAPLLVGRVNATATLLGNGKVLVAGGYNFNSLSSAELYDPVSNSWSAAAPMATARELHTATLLANGKVLVTGGYGNGTDGYLASAELYDPGSNTWSPVASMSTARDGHTATLLGTGKVLVTGGLNGTSSYLASAELYDPISNSWSSAGAIAAARSGHTATLLGNGQVLVAGGNNNGTAVSIAQLYDPARNAWSTLTSMAYPRMNHTATLLGNGKVLVAGGRGSPGAGNLSSAELYDPITNTWSAAGPLAIGRAYFTATLLASGKVLAAGGQGDGYLASAELYDPVNNAWSSAGAMAAARSFQTAIRLASGDGLVIGGLTNGTSGIYLRSAEFFQETKNADPSRSSITVTPGSILIGGTAKVTITARDASGNQQPTGGLYFGFGLGAGTGSGTFSNLTDNNDGTYTAIFTGTAVGLITVTATLNGQAITSPAPTLIIDAPSQLLITGLNPTRVTAGDTVTFTVTVENSAGQKLPNFRGTVTLSSTDSNAMLGSSRLLTTYTFAASDNGAHTFTVTLQTAGAQTITLTYQASALLTATTDPITVVAGPFSKFAVNLPGGTILQAGIPFLVTVQAADRLGNPVSSYSGPGSVKVATVPTDRQSSFPTDVTLLGGGFGVFQGTFKTAGSYTITATAGSFSGSSADLAVIPGDPLYFRLATPTSAATGTPFDITIRAYDHYGNVATGYNGHVRLTSTDISAALPSDLRVLDGVASTSITLNTGGSHTITAVDTVATQPVLIGTSSAITTRGLTVSGLTPTATGFTVTFNRAIDTSRVFLYGGTVASPVQDVTLVGTNSGPVNGSLIIDPSGTWAIFKASSTFLQTFFEESVLPNDTWTVTLVSGTGAGSTANGFFDALGGPLDGAGNGGHANYTTTFTTANEGKPVLSIPDFARGPDAASTIRVPNDSAQGIPITLSGAVAVRDVVFRLTYNPALFSSTGAGVGDASGTGTFLSRGAITMVDATHAAVTFTWHSSTALTGTVVLGDILGNVPNSAAQQYQAKELLHLSAILVNNTVFTGVVADAVHINAYLGDVTGDGKITALDVATALIVAQGNPTAPIGLSAYRLVDPAIVGDVGGNASIDATAVSLLAAYTANVHPLQIPTLPPGVVISPSGPDPTLSLGRGLESSGTVPVLLDDPRPDDSTGMTEAILALTYDPTVLTVSAADITLGSIPGSGEGWHLESVVDQATGQIGIDLYSTTPISLAQAGSLVNITFHVLPKASVPATTVHLVSAVAPEGRWFSTEVADGEGQFVLSPGPDGLVIQTGLGFRSAKANLHHKR
jgi:N-acetylneuraminic acid mutarotase